MHIVGAAHWRLEVVVGATVWYICPHTLVVAQTRSEVAVGSFDWYCESGLQVLRVAQVRSEFEVGTVAWYLPALVSQGVRLVQERSDW